MAADRLIAAAAARSLSIEQWKVVAAIASAVPTGGALALLSWRDLASALGSSLGEARHTLDGLTDAGLVWVISTTAGHVLVATTQEAAEAALSARSCESGSEVEPAPAIPLLDIQEPIQLRAAS